MMTGRDLTPQEALEALFDSDASPIDAENPKEWAETIVQWLLDSGARVPMRIGGSHRGKGRRGI
jgi:hypothetical protein